MLYLLLSHFYISIIMLANFTGKNLIIITEEKQMLKKSSTKKHLTQMLAIALVLVSILSVGSISVSAYSTLTGKGIQQRPLTFYAVSGTDSLYTSSLQSCMSTWNNAGYGTMFRYGGTKNKLANALADGTSTFYTITLSKTGVYAVTTTHYNISTNYIQEVDMSLNTAYNYSSIIVDGVDLASVLTHELGHALGLDHSSNTEATMYHSYSNGETKKRSLHTDDLNGLAYLYG